MVASVGTDLERRIGDYMSGGHPAAHGDHGGHGAKHGTKRKRHNDVGKEHQEMYDKIVEEIFDPADHRKITQAHNDAYISSIATLKGKEFDNRFDAEEALVDALIKYRKETGIPVSEDAEHRHYVYNEVRGLLEGLNQEGQLAGKVDQTIREGNLYELFGIIHRNETHKKITGKIEYKLNKELPHDQEPEFYQGVLKAHGNHVGRFYKKAELAKQGNKNQLIANFKGFYDAEIDRMLEDYVDTHKKSHADHGADHGDGGHGH